MTLILSLLYHNWLFVHLSVEHKKKVKRAMELWSEKTCIKFERISKAESKNMYDFVTIRYHHM